MNHSGDTNKMVGEDHIRDATKMVSEDVSNEQMTAQATPNEELRRQILSHVVPKNEREWWAASAIERLELELNAANQRIKRLEGELESTKADRDSWSNQSDEFAKTAADLMIHIQRLEREVELLRLYGNKDCTDQADEVLKEEVK